MSEAKFLPLEVIYQIVDILADDPPTLCVCALTGTALVACARTNLYKHIAPAFSHQSQQGLLLSRTLSSNPALGTLVQSLKISERLCREQPLLTPELLPFHHLAELRVLTLYLVEISGVDGICAILAALPKLERLVCDSLLDTTHMIPPETTDEITSPRSKSRLALFPTLKELSVKHGHWRHAELAERLLLHRPSAIADLQSLDVSFGCSSDALAWVPVVRTAGARLRSLSMSMADRSPRLDQLSSPAINTEQHASDHAYVLDNIAHCPGLQSLCLKYNPDPFAFVYIPYPHDLLDTLCDTLERRPPPWPALESLTLWMSDRDGQMPAVSPALCARLASVLLDTARYPRFARFTIRVGSQVWMPGLLMWSLLVGSGPGGRVERGVVGERWRAAFAAFARARGVVLDVDTLHSPR